MMTPVHYYKLCLGLPLLVAVLLFPIIRVVTPLVGFETPFTIVIGLEVSFLFIGSLPYLMTILPLLWYGWNRDASWWRNLLFVLPIIYAVVLGFSYAVVGGFVFPLIRVNSGSVSWSEHEALVFAGAVLVVGYPYVGLCHLGLFVLRRLGVIKEA